MDGHANQPAGHCLDISLIATGSAPWPYLHRLALK
jgi:hypothetical protein